MESRDDEEKVPRKKFDAYRYSVIKSQQMQIPMDGVNNQKRDVFRELAEHCFSGNEAVSDDQDQKFTLLRVRRIAYDGYLFKLCKRTSSKTYDIDHEAMKVTEHKQDNYPFSKMIMVLEDQTIFIEHRSEAFRNSKSARNALLAIVRNFVQDDNYYIAIEEISDTSRFWDTIDSADSVKSVTLDLKAPNFLGTGYDTTNLLSAVKKATNNDSMKIVITSDNGDLVIHHDDFDDAIAYAGAGGGSWKTSTMRGGKRVSEKSGDHGVHVDIAISDSPTTNDKTIMDRIKMIGAKRKAIGHGGDGGHKKA